MKDARQKSAPHVTVINTPPIVTIVRPDPDGALTFFAGETITYAGSVFDADLNADVRDLQWDLLSTSGGPALLTDEGLIYSWKLREQGVVVGEFGTPTSVITPDLEPGKYVLELVAADMHPNDSQPYRFPFIITTLN